MDILPLSVHCRLNGWIPKDGKWTEESKKLWQSKMEEEEELKAIFVRYDPEANFYDVDLFCGEENFLEILADFVEEKKDETTEKTEESGQFEIAFI